MKQARWVAEFGARCIAAAALLILATNLPGFASSDAALCERAAHQVARETGVPADVLQALTLTETGRRQAGAVRPWPWSVNAEGKGTWFPTSAEARDQARALAAAGKNNFDAGCFQINYRWHGEAFSSVDEMFDPVANTRYAANFLRRLHAEFGDWRDAVGAFHSRTPHHANRYLARFDELRAGLSQTGTDHSVETYNQFANAAAPERLSEPAPIPRTMLGVPLGSGTTRGAGSLATLARVRGPLLVRPSGPLIGARPVADPVEPL